MKLHEMCHMLLKTKLVRRFSLKTLTFVRRKSDETYKFNEFNLKYTQKWYKNNNSKATLSFC